MAENNSGKSQGKKYIPMRTCIVTGMKKPKNELLRLVLTPENRIVIDLTGKAKGRGANILPEVPIFQKAIAKKILNRALKISRNLTDTEINSLEKEFADAIAEKNFRKGSHPVTIKVGKLAE